MKYFRVSFVTVKSLNILFRNRDKKKTQALWKETAKMKLEKFIWKVIFVIRFRGHRLSTYAKFSEKLTFLTPWYAEVKNVNFSENFAYVLNEWPLNQFLLVTIHKYLYCTLVILYKFTLHLFFFTKCVTGFKIWMDNWRMVLAYLEQDRMI